MKSILITGGLGFLGSHTCSLLLEKNFCIYIIDSLSNSSLTVLNRIKKINNSSLKKGKENFIKFFKGDVRDFENLKEIFLQALSIGKPIDAVIHFAGLKSVQESFIYENNYWDVNVEGTRNVLKVMNEFNCNTLIFSSSATVYGNCDSNIITEGYDINPCNIYGKTKARAESIIKEKYDSSRKWKIMNLRYFNPIGAHKSGLIGEAPNKSANNLFPMICRVASGEIEHLKIFGKDWNTRDGTCIRDYIHVMDIAFAHLAALYYLEKKESKFISINLGTEKGTTVLELIKTFEKISNKKIKYSFCQRREGDVACYVASNALALKHLFWYPKLSLTEMCEDGWKWYKKYKNL